jgi:hypothetical protein
MAKPNNVECVNMQAIDDVEAELNFTLASRAAAFKRKPTTAITTWCA